MHQSTSAVGGERTPSAQSVLRLLLPCILVSGCVDLDPPWDGQDEAVPLDAVPAVDVQAASDDTLPIDRTADRTAASNNADVASAPPDAGSAADVIIDDGVCAVDEQPDATTEDDGPTRVVAEPDTAEEAPVSTIPPPDVQPPLPDLPVAPEPDVAGESFDVFVPPPDVAPIGPEEPLPSATIVSLDGLKIWLRADRGFASVAGAAAVWTSVADPPVAAAADSNAASPAWVATSANLGGKPGLLFDGNNDGLRISPRPVQDDFTIALVLSTTSTLGSQDSCWGQNRGLVDGNVFGRSLDFGMGIGSDGRIHVGVGTGFLLLPDFCMTSSGEGINNGCPHVAIFTRTMNIGVFTLHVDGTLEGTAIGAFGSLTAPTSITIGQLQDTTPSNPFAGLIAEVLIYARALPDGARKAVEGYLGARYGFSVAQ